MNITEKTNIINVIVSYLKTYKVKEIGFFGSFVRNEMTPESDIDVLVTYERGTSLFDVVRMHQELAEKVGRKVDIVSRDAVRPMLMEYIKKDLQVVYHA